MRFNVFSSGGLEVGLEMFVAFYMLRLPFHENNMLVTEFALKDDMLADREVFDGERE